METVPIEKLTRFYLLKQFLLHKAQGDKVVDSVDAICGLHAQLASTPYFSLWNRVRDFDPKILDKSLYVEKSLVKTWCMRGTLHIIPSKDLPIYHHALKRTWFEHHGRFMRKPDWPSLEERQRLLYPKILEVLGAKPLRRKELSEKVRLMLRNKSVPYTRLFSAWGGILKETCYLGFTVFAQPCGKEACFARLDKWLPQISLDQIDEDQAKAKLLLKYLHGYGPASIKDFSYWSGLLTSETSKTVETTKTELKGVHMQGSKETFWMLKDDLSALEKIDENAEVSPCLLPKFDPYLLGHKDKTRIINKPFLKKVYRPAGDIAASILIDGHIAGTWTYKKTKKKLTLSITPFERITNQTLKALERVANDFGTFMNIEQTKILLNK